MYKYEELWKKAVFVGAPVLLCATLALPTEHVRALLKLSTCWWERFM